MSDAGLCKCGPLFKAGLSLWLVWNLTACAVSGQAGDVNPGQGETPAPAAGSEAVQTPAEPKTTEPLTRQMLFDVLLAEIAGQRGRLDVSVPHYLQAALESRDPRVAERAIQIASYAKNYPAALRAARHWVTLEENNLDARKIVAALALQTGDIDEVVDQLDFAGVAQSVGSGPTGVGAGDASALWEAPGTEDAKGEKLRPAVRKVIETYKPDCTRRPQLS